MNKGRTGNNNRRARRTNAAPVEALGANVASPATPATPAPLLNSSFSTGPTEKFNLRLPLRVLAVLRAASVREQRHQTWIARNVLTKWAEEYLQQRG